jgi:predicted nucleic acid-binding protein
MPDLFVDTAGWGNLADRKQHFHPLANRRYRAARQQGRKIVTTNYVLAELVALLSSPIRMPRPAAITVVEDVRASTYVEVIHVDPTLDVEAWQFLRSRPDKEWSLVDCVSFVVMSKRGILEALTTDHHFEQAGFVRLLK